MNLDEIKEIIEIDGGKFIIVENGKPVMVIASFEDYKKNLLKGISKTPSNPAPKSKDNPPKKFPKELENDITIEDLPL